MEIQVLGPKRQRFNGENYYKCGPYYSREVEPKDMGLGRMLLHRAVWEFHNGPINDPKMHVHHLDGDRSNNQITNLQLMNGHDHQSSHMTPARRAWARENVKHAIAAAPEWHHSEEGKAWHSQQMIAIQAAMPMIEYTCEECGLTFSVKAYRRKTREFEVKYCGGTCKMRAYRRRKLDPTQAVNNETATEKQCEVCGISYMTNRPSQSKHCSPICTQRALSQRKRAQKDSGYTT
jgi:Tfp pilus assembly protein PilV